MVYDYIRRIDESHFDPTKTTGKMENVIKTINIINVSMYHTNVKPPPRIIIWSKIDSQKKQNKHVIVKSIASSLSLESNIILKWSIIAL